MSAEQSNARRWRDERTDTPGVYRRGPHYRVLIRPDGKRKVMHRFDSYEEAVAFKNAQPRKTRRREATRHGRLTRYLLSDPCPYCGRRAEEIDHVHPQIRGGRSHWSNLVGICGPCNRAKHGKSLLAFLLTYTPPPQRPQLPEGRDLFAYLD